MTELRQDTILPFQLDKCSVRGRIARLPVAVDEILSAHNYPESVSALVAELATIVCLLGQMIKLRWRLSIQVRASTQDAGAVSLVFADYIASQAPEELPRIRAYAVYDAQAVLDKSRALPFDLLDPKGTVSLSVDQGPGTQPYQGMTPVAGNSLSDCLQVYFAQSEQIATRILTHFKRTAGHWNAGGILLQHMPQSEKLIERPSVRVANSDGLLRASDIARINGYEEDWNRVNILLDTTEQAELLDPSVKSETVLHRLFHQETPRIYETKFITSGCTCSRDKIESALQLSQKADLEAISDENGELQAQCQFCGTTYSFKKTDIN